MAFIWNDTPNYPTVTPPPFVGPNEVSTEVNIVANTVNVSGIVGTLSYNTANKGYDVIYELPSLNVQNLRAQTLTARSATINTAFINTATITTATINTANISSATIASGMMGVHPVQNLQIATKEYADTLVANSLPQGGNLQLLILAAGDLLVGVSDNTAERLPVGTSNGSVLIVGGSGNTGLRWSTRSQGATQTTRGLFIGTNQDDFARNNEVQLLSVDEIVMDDGTRVSTGWNGLTASIRSNVATSGVGYLDTGVVSDNTCYEVWAIRSSSNGAQGLILHKALDRRVTERNDPAQGVNIQRKIRYEHGGGQISCVNVAQSFVAARSGPLTGIELTLGRVGSPVGNCWITLENNVGGNASGIPLATSRYIDAGRIITSVSSNKSRLRFVFDTTANVASGNTYWFVVQGDYPTAHFGPAENYLEIWGFSNELYPNGSAKNFTSNTNTWVVANSLQSGLGPQGPADLYFRTFVEANNTDLLMPAGYDQKCLVSYTFTDFLTNLREYHQRNRRMTMAFYYPWCFLYAGGMGFPRPGSGAEQAWGTSGQVSLEVLNMEGYCPPVPCLVSFHCLGAQSLTCLGDLNCVDLGGNLATANVGEYVGGFIANSATTGGGVQTHGPIVVEQCAMLVRLASSSHAWVADLEF